jgi:hypothetical protein
MLPPRSTPGTPWQNTQLLTYSMVPACTLAGSYFTPCTSLSMRYCTKSGILAVPPTAKV